MATFSGTPDPSERPARSCVVAVPFVRFVPFLFGLLFHPLDCTPCDALRLSPDPSPEPPFYPRYTASDCLCERDNTGACVSLRGATRLYPRSDTHEASKKGIPLFSKMRRPRPRNTHTYADSIALTSCDSSRSQSKSYDPQYMGRVPVPTHGTMG